MTTTPTHPLALHPAVRRPTSRREVVDLVTALLEHSGARWAWQGDDGAVERWIRSSDTTDLDLWCSGPGPDGLLLRSLDAALGARVVHADDPRRLRHASWAVELPDGLAVVDLTLGPLAVGAVRLVDEGDVEVVPGPAGPALAGAAAVADLLLRRLARGRSPSPAGLRRSREVWSRAGVAERARITAAVRALAARRTPDVLAVLDGADPDPALGRSCRRRLALRTVLDVRATSAAWRAVLPAGRAAGPLGLRTRGVVVTLVGTDGAGKSTVAETLRVRLQDHGLPTRTVYFGMARGNLPGVALARRLLGVAPDADGRDAAAADPPAAPSGHAGLRRLAAWYYAVEYLWRWGRTIAPGLLRREVVLVDRWVWDLRESPWPASRAPRFLERLVPPPHVVALADAPADLIHRRKPERTEAEQARQQQVFHAIIRAHPARSAEVVVDTSGAEPDPVRGLVATVVAATHRRGRLA